MRDDRGRAAWWWGPLFPVLLLLVSGVAVLPPGDATVVCPDDGCRWFHGDRMVLDAFDAEVRVQDQLAHTTLEFRFHNDDGVGREARFDVPLPPGAALAAFSLALDDRTLHGVVKERAVARATYEEAKAAGDDAVLLHEVDASRVRLTVHTPPEATRTLTVSYLEHVDVAAGARAYRLDTSRLSGLALPVPVVHLVLDVRSSHGISDFSLPGETLGVTVERAGQVRAERTLHDVAQMDDLVAVWTEGSGVWVSSLVAAEDPAEPDAGETHFLASLHYRPDDGEVTLPRDIVFVLDTSGSMADQKIVQARDSLREVLLELRPDDRFGVVRFADGVTTMTPELQPAGGSAVSGMRDRLATIEAAGSTNLDGGLQAALALIGPQVQGRVPLVVLLSDGMPTTGVTAESQIVARLHAANDAEAAVHVIAIGIDADDSFLEDIAGQTGGSLTALTPGADLQERLAHFYASLQDPVLTDVRVMVEGVQASGLYPKVLPSLYRDDTLRVVFRANASDVPGLYVRIIGLGTGGIVDESFGFGTASMTVVPQVERVWGAMHVAALVARERQEGASGDLRDAIVANATMYGVVTQHTSWVIADTAPEAGSGSGATLQGVPSPSAPTPAGDATDPASDTGTDPASDTGTDPASDTGTDPAAEPEPTPLPGGDRPPADPFDAPPGDVAGEDEPTPGPALAVFLLALVALLVVVRHRRP